MADIALVHRGEHPHPAHQGFAEAIGADIVGLDRYSLPHSRLRHSIFEEIMNGAIIPEYDIYISEGTRALYGTLTKCALSGNCLIYLGGDHDLYKLTEEEYELNSLLNRMIRKNGMGALKTAFSRYIDGSIVISDFVADSVKEISPNKPCRVAHPYIQPDVYRELEEVSPDLDSKVAVTVGAHSYYKGHDILVDAWDIVKEEHPEARLLLVGSGYPDHFNAVDGITVKGYVEDLSGVLEESSLYVHPSRADGFAVSVVEAMLAGLPAIVTTTTGSKSEVQEVDGSLVTEPKSKSLAEAIVEYFDRPIEEKNQTSRSARERGKSFDSGRRKKIFEEEFNIVLSEISVEV